MEGGRVGKKGLGRGRAVYIEKLIKEQSARFLLALSFLLFVFLDANMILEITKLFLIQSGTEDFHNMPPSLPMPCHRLDGDQWWPIARHFFLKLSSIMKQEQTIQKTHGRFENKNVNKRVNLNV